MGVNVPAAAADVEHSDVVAKCDELRWQNPGIWGQKGSRENVAECRSTRCECPQMSRFATAGEKREDMLALYQAEAIRKYGERTGKDMAGSLESWVRVRGVH